MEEAIVNFLFNGLKIFIQCTPEDKMKEICLQFASKIKVNINLLVFLYGGNQMNLELTFKEQASSLDNEKKEMNVLVQEKVLDDFICPKCGEKIQINEEKIKEIVLANNNIIDTLNGIKFNIDNIFKISTTNIINIQLKNINALLNNVIEGIKKNIKRVQNLFNNTDKGTDGDCQNLINYSMIKGILEIKIKEKNKNIILFNSDIDEGIDVYLGNKKINMIKDDFKWKIGCKFKKDGEYKFKIIFEDTVTNMQNFFENCTNIKSLDFSDFDTSKVTSMEKVFNECHKLKEIKGLDKFVTDNVTNMIGMFQSCKELEKLDLTSFNTSNVTNMDGMFNECFKLKEIKGINNFNTNKVTSMKVMFQLCRELENLDLFGFNTVNVENMSWMFNKCDKLKYLDLSNFSLSKKCETKLMFTFENKNKCKFITNNTKLLKLFNSS